MTDKQETKTQQQPNTCSAIDEITKAMSDITMLDLAETDAEPKVNIMLEMSNIRKLLQDTKDWTTDTKNTLIERYEKLEVEVLKRTPNDKPHTYKLDSNTPTYSGNSDEDAERWLQIIQNNMAAVGVPDDKRLLVLCNYFTIRIMLLHHF